MYISFSCTKEKALEQQKHVWVGEGDGALLLFLTKIGLSCLFNHFVCFSENLHLLIFVGFKCNKWH